jgi:hypothetical protein
MEVINKAYGFLVHEFMCPSCFEEAGWKPEAADVILTNLQDHIATCCMCKGVIQ